MTNYDITFYYIKTNSVKFLFPCTSSKFCASIICVSKYAKSERSKAMKRSSVISVIDDGLKNQTTIDTFFIRWKRRDMFL